MLWYQSIPKWFQRLFPRMLWQVPSNSSQDIYLTFDDGPHPDISNWVLEQLEKYNMKATFFCVGDNARKFPDTLNKIQARGHQIANHTMHHLKGWNTKTEDYIKNVDECAQYVSSNLFRPPYGKITTAQRKQLEQRYKIIMWSILSCDFDQKLNTKEALKGLKTKSKNGSIVVFHDSVKAEKNLKLLLPPYLEYLHNQGYTCKTL